MLRLAFLLCLVASSAFAQSTQTIPFRRMTDPVQITVGASAQPTMVPPEKLVDPSTPSARLTSFYVVNPNNFWVRAKGFANASDCNATGVTPTTGWLWPPGHVAVYSTQYPVCASAMAVPMPGFPLPADAAMKPLEWSYGYGQ
jgi:hypothetical protein